MPCEHYFSSATQPFIIKYCINKSICKMLDISLKKSLNQKKKIKNKTRNFLFFSFHKLNMKSVAFKFLLSKFCFVLFSVLLFSFVLWFICLFVVFVVFVVVVIVVVVVVVDFRYWAPILIVLLLAHLSNLRYKILRICNFGEVLQSWNACHQYFRFYKPRQNISWW